MNNESCILTSKDITILEVMRDRCMALSDPLRPLLVRKIRSATVVFLDDVPRNVATLNSRVAYTIDGREAGPHILSHDQSVTLVGMTLPIASTRGLALLGLREGQEFVLANGHGGQERIRLDKVLYQPEAAREERLLRERMETPAGRRARLQVVGGN